MEEREKEEEALGTQGLVEVTVMLALVGCVCIWKGEVPYTIQHFEDS